MSKKGAPKSISTIEDNIKKLKRDIRIARIILFSLTGFVVLYFLAVSFLPIADLLGIGTRMVMFISMVLFMLVLLASGVASNYIKIKKENLQEQQSYLEAAQKRQ